MPGVFQFLRFEDRFEKLRFHDGLTLPRGLGKDSAISYPCIVEVDVNSDGNMSEATLAWSLLWLL